MITTEMAAEVMRNHTIEIASASGAMGHKAITWYPNDGLFRVKVTDRENKVKVDTWHLQLEQAVHSFNHESLAIAFGITIS